MTSKPSLRFAAIGLNHPHIYGQTVALLDAGAELVAVHAEEDDLAAAYIKRFPQARRVADRREILEDTSIPLIVSATIPDTRAATAIEVMRHGKDVMVDKPGVITLTQLDEVRRVQAETGRILSVCFSERFENRATEKASRLVAAGAIGRVVQTVGLGPHALRNNPRPDWFFQRQRYGGILCDIAAHQCDQFLHFTGSTRAEVVASHIANHGNPDTPELEDFGEVLLRGNGGTGYIRVDWFTPRGLGVWGDGRLTILERIFTDTERAKANHHLKMPVLFLHGIHDFVCATVDTRLADPMREHCSNLTEATVSSGHWMAQEKPTEVNAAVAKWISALL